MRIQLESNDSHDSVNHNYFPISPKPWTKITQLYYFLDTNKPYPFHYTSSVVVCHPTRHLVHVFSTAGGSVVMKDVIPQNAAEIPIPRHTHVLSHQSTDDVPLSFLFQNKDVH